MSAWNPQVIQPPFRKGVERSSYTRDTGSRTRRACLGGDRLEKQLNEFRNVFGPPCQLRRPVSTPPQQARALVPTEIVSLLQPQSLLALQDWCRQRESAAAERAAVAAKAAKVTNGDAAELIEPDMTADCLQDIINRLPEQWIAENGNRYQQLVMALHGLRGGLSSAAAKNAPATHIPESSIAHEDRQDLAAELPILHSLHSKSSRSQPSTPFLGPGSEPPSSHFPYLPFQPAHASNPLTPRLGISPAANWDIRPALGDPVVSPSCGVAKLYFQCSPKREQRSDARGTLRKPRTPCTTSRNGSRVERVSSCTHRVAGITAVPLRPVPPSPCPGTSPQWQPKSPSSLELKRRYLVHDSYGRSRLLSDDSMVSLSPLPSCPASRRTSQDCNPTSAFEHKVEYEPPTPSFESVDGASTAFEHKVEYRPPSADSFSEFYM